MSNPIPATAPHLEVKRSWWLSSEDWWAVYLGLFLVVVAYLVFGTKSSPLDFLKVGVPTEWPKTGLASQLLGNLKAYLGMYLILLVLTSIAVKGMGIKLGHYIGAFTILFVLSLIALVIGSQQWIHHNGIEYPFWALLIGLLIENFWKTPAWFRTAADRVEFFIKIGIVLLGATLSFTVILAGGLRGLLEAVTIITLGFTTAFLISKALGYDNKFAATLGAGGSVCGVSAAIAMGSSVGAKDEDVGYVVSLVVLYALVLVFLLPILSHAIHLNDVTAGTWIGGSELADAAGLASAGLISDKAMKAFTLVKLNRDVLLGILSFIFAWISVARWEVREQKAGRSKVSASVIWVRFPKFVLAFLLVSLFVTYLTGTLGVKPVTAHFVGVLNAIRLWLFVMAFLCIGLNTRIKRIKDMGWNPIKAFTTVAVVNVVTGFIMANLLFRHFVIK